MARARLQLVAQETDGDVRGAQSIQILNPDGSAFTGTLYDALSGGSVITSPQPTNSGGLLEVYTDLTTAKRVLLRTSGASDLKAHFDYDPQDVIVIGMNRAAVLDGYAGVSDYVATLKPTTGGATGNKIFAAKNSDGTVAFEVSALGGGGGGASLIGSYHNTSVGPFVVSPVRNWDSGADMFVNAVKLTGTVTGSHQVANFSYQTCATPSDGFNGSTNIPDHVVANFDYFAQNIASGASQNHDGSGRAIEIQTIVYQSTGKKRTMGAMSAGIHTAVDQISGLDVILAGSGTADTEYGSVGIYVHTGQQPYTGYGTGVRANTAFLAWGSLGYKQGFAYLDTDNSLLWCVDKFGDVYSRDVLPRPGASANIGTAARVWTTGHFGTIIANNGAAANPSQAFIGAGGSDSGLFGSASGSLVGVGIAGTEKARFDASGLALAAGFRIQNNGVAIISPSQITADQNNYSPTGLSTAQVLLLTSDAARNITGIVAQTAGTVLKLINLGSFSITLKHNSGSSSAGNKIFGPSSADIVIVSFGAVELIYSTGSSGWVKASG